MGWKIAPPAAMACGLFLILGGYVWPMVVGKGMVYSEDQAVERMRASGELHRAFYSHAEAEHEETNEIRKEPGVFVAHTHGDGAESVEQAKAELDKAQQDYDAATAALHSARRWRSVPAFLLKSFGCLAALAGVVGYFVLKSAWGQQFVEEE